MNVSKLNSAQAFKGTIFVPGKRQFPQDNHPIMGDWELSTNNIDTIATNFNKAGTYITFKDKSPRLYTEAKDMSTKDIIAAYTAAKMNTGLTADCTGLDIGEKEL